MFVLFIKSSAITSDFSLSTLTTRSETTNVSVYHLSLVTLQMFSRFVKIRQVIDALASAPSGPLILRILDENFSRPFPPTPREKQSPLSSRKFNFPSRRSLSFFEENNKSINDRRAFGGRCIWPKERQITRTISLPAIIDCP